MCLSSPEVREEAERTDQEEDRLFGKKRGDELPAELARRESRLAKIREAKAALEPEAREQAEEKAAGARRRLAEREEKEKERGRKFRGRPPRIPDPATATPGPKAREELHRSRFPHHGGRSRQVLRAGL